jgi:hypothetical protein
LHLHVFILKKKKWKTQQLSEDEESKCFVAHLEELDFSDKTLDLVLYSRIKEHLEDRIAQRLAQDGKIQD